MLKAFIEKLMFSVTLFRKSSPAYLIMDISYSFDLALHCYMHISTIFQNLYLLSNGSKHRDPLQTI